MRAFELITGHVIFKLCYNQIYQMKNHPYEIKICTFYSMMKAVVMAVAIMTMTNIPIRIPIQIQIVIIRIKFK